MANTHNMDTQWCNIATLQHYNMIMLMTMIMILIIAMIMKYGDFGDIGRCPSLLGIT